MDNNTPLTPPQAPTPPPMGMPNTADSGMPPVVPQTIPPSSGSKKMILMIVLAFVVVGILLAVGIYMYMRAQQSNPELQQVSTNKETNFNDLTEEVDSVEDASPGADFKEVDSELNSL